MSLAEPKNEQGTWKTEARGQSFEALARMQGVQPVKRLNDLLGGWPAEERADGFEQAVRRWREEGD